MDLRYHCHWDVVVVVEEVWFVVVEVVVDAEVVVVAVESTLKKSMGMLAFLL